MHPNSRLRILSERGITSGRKNASLERSRRFLFKENEWYEYLSPLDAISTYCYRFKKPKTIEELRKLLFIDIAKPGRAHAAFAQIPFDIVITTNFDFLLEDAYKTRDQPCLPILDEDQLSTSIPNQLPDNRNIVRLLKIHGDLHLRKDWC